MLILPFESSHFCKILIDLLWNMHFRILKRIATSGFLTALNCTKFVFGRTLQRSPKPTRICREIQSLLYNVKIAAKSAMYVRQTMRHADWLVLLHSDWIRFDPYLSRNQLFSLQMMRKWCKISILKRDKRPECKINVMLLSKLCCCDI